jgi:hypothetical protein
MNKLFLLDLNLDLNAAETQFAYRLVPDQILKEPYCVGCLRG